MASLSDLETRFKNRLGVTTLSTVGSAQVREAINAAASRLASDGVPGLSTNYFTAATAGSSTITISAHSATSSSVDFTSLPSGIFAGDIVKFPDGVYRLVYAVTDADTLDFGAGITDAQTGTCTLYQRCVALPTAGRIVEMINLDDYTKLTPDPNALGRYGLEPHTAVERFTQGHDNASPTATAYAILWPAHTNAVNLAVKQYKSLTDGDDVNWPDETLDAVMSKAIDIWRSWRVGGVSPVEADLSKRDVKDSGDGRNVSSPRKPQVRGR
jgi:hypothetical protein